MDTLEYDLHTDALTRAGALTGWQHDGRTFRATFERGRLELYSAFDGAVRVRFAEGEFAPRRSWAVTEPDDAFGAPDFAVDEGDTLTLTLPFVTIHLGYDGTLRFEKDGHTFAEDAAPAGWAAASLDASTMRVRAGDTIPEGPAGREVQLFKRLRDDEHYYGFGQRTGMLERLSDQGTQAVIPPKTTRLTSRSYDAERYKDRHLIENFFLKLKHFRAIATRYDKTRQNFLAAIYLAAVTIWLA